MFTRQTVMTVLVATFALLACGQYPGQVTKKSKDNPELRAIAVMEWTGEQSDPKTARLVPVTVYDGAALQDGNVYLARPLPLALAGEVEYELENNGKATGLFDIRNSGQEQGSWVGYGAWKPLPVPAPKPPPVIDEGAGNDNSDQPVLHRKKHSGDAPGGDSSKTGGSAGSGAPTQPSDPDRPTLHKNPSTDDSSSSSSSSSPDPDRPTLHGKKTKAPDESTSAASSAATPAPGFTDPDRPLLKRGKSSGNNLGVLPSLMGLPPEMKQAVAVSDAKAHPDHPWTYVWANAADETKMKEALESIARDALGLTPPPPPAHTPRHTATTRTATRTKARPAPPPPPTPLADEQFRVFELTYGSGATMVLTAHTDGPAAQQKFVTLVAQPDLYGNVRVLLKSVTDGSHLDETPRMRLVDAVDALADNRGELLFELRGATQRQFALYRVLRGTAEKLFVSGGGAYGTLSSDTGP